MDVVPGFVTPPPRRSISEKQNRFQLGAQQRTSIVKSVSHKRQLMSKSLSMCFK